MRTIIKYLKPYTRKMLLAANRIHNDIVVARVNTDNHAFVELIARFDKHTAAILQLPKSVGNGFTVILANQHTVRRADSDRGAGKSDLHGNHRA